MIRTENQAHDSRRQYDPTKEEDIYIRLERHSEISLRSDCAARKVGGVR